MVDWINPDNEKNVERIISSIQNSIVYLSIINIDKNLKIRDNEVNIN